MAEVLAGRVAQLATTAEDKSLPAPRIHALPSPMPSNATTTSSATSLMTAAWLVAGQPAVDQGSDDHGQRGGGKPGSGHAHRREICADLRLCNSLRTAGLRRIRGGAGNNGPVSTARVSSFLNCPGGAVTRGWSLAWPERVVGVAGSLVNFAALVSLGLPGVPGPLQLRG
jgi:hypothetical protein